MKELVRYLFENLYFDFQEAVKPAGGEKKPEAAGASST